MRTLPSVLVVGNLALLLAGCRACQPSRPPRPPPPGKPVLDRTAVLAELPEEPAPAWAPALLGPPAPAPPPDHSVEYFFSERGGGVAWAEPQPGGKVRVYHNGQPGPVFDEIVRILLSDDGLHHAYFAFTGSEPRLIVDGKERARYPGLGALALSPDGAHVAFESASDSGAKMFVDGTLRRSGSESFLTQAFSADSSRLFVFERADADSARLVVVEVASQSDPFVLVDHVDQYKVSEDRTRMAVVSREDGGLRVLAFDTDRPRSLSRGRKYERVAALEFGDGGEPLAYYALREGQTYFVVEGEEIPLQPGEQIVGGAAGRPGRSGFGALVKKGGAVTFRQFLMDPAPQEQSYEEAFGVAYGGGGRVHAYAARRHASWFVVVNGKEGPAMDAVRPPAVSPDGRFVVYRARRDGKRFVVVAGPDARTVREHAAYEQVHDVHFTADGRSIAYGVKDGRRLAWMVEPL
jgi:hypothetical protein